MSYQDYVSTGQVFILVAGILAAVGTYFVVHFKAKIDAQPKVHFQTLRAYYVEDEKDKYRLGLVAQILNKNATQAYVVRGVSYEGGFQIAGGDASYAIRNFVWNDASAKIQGKYFLSPGGETFIKFQIPHTVEMHIIGGTPGIQFNGSWTIQIEDMAFRLVPETVKIERVISIKEWESL